MKNKVFILFAFLLFSFGTQACVWTITNDTEKAVIVVSNTGKALFISPRKKISIDTTIEPILWKTAEKYVLRESFLIYLSTNEDSVFQKRYKISEKSCIAQPGEFKISEVGRDTPNITTRFSIRSFDPKIKSNDSSWSWFAKKDKGPAKSKNDKKKKKRNIDKRRDRRAKRPKE